MLEFIYGVCRHFGGVLAQPLWRGISESVETDVRHDPHATGNRKALNASSARATKIRE